MASFVVSSEPFMDPLASRKPIARPTDTTSGGFECKQDISTFAPTPRLDYTGEMAKRRNRTAKAGGWFTAPSQTQGIAMSVAGLSAAWEMFWSGITGKNHDAWYDRLLHVIGALLIFGLFIGGLVLLVFGRWKH